MKGGSDTVEGGHEKVRQGAREAGSGGISEQGGGGGGGEGRRKEAAKDSGREVGGRDGRKDGKSRRKRMRGKEIGRRNGGRLIVTEKGNDGVEGGGGYNGTHTGKVYRAAVSIEYVG